jgi:peptidyl-prolyl cis-trans isomerase D
MAMRMPGAQYDRWVVVKLDNIKKKGIPEFEDVKEMMKLEVLRAKKGDIQAKQMQGAKSLEELATRLKTNVHETELTFSSISFPDLPESGTEYRVIGSIFSMKKPGDMSVALKGENGVYVVMLTNITEATPLPNVEESRKNLTNALRGNAQGGAYQALRELAKIEDTRPIN